MMNTQTRPEFQTVGEAQAWLDSQMEGEDCVDNHRFAFEDDAIAMNEYDEDAANGCCGSFDCYIMVAGRKATIGCNYGH